MLHHQAVYSNYSKNFLFNHSYFKNIDDFDFLYMPFLLHSHIKKAWAGNHSLIFPNKTDKKDKVSLSITKRIIAIQCGFFLDAMLHNFLNALLR